MRISDWSSDVFSSDLFDDVAGRFNRTLCHSDRFEQHLNVQLVATKHYLAPAEIIADRRQRLVELVREGRCHRTHRIHARYVNKLVLQLLGLRSEEHTSELQSLMRISYAVFCLKKKKHTFHSISTLPTHSAQCAFTSPLLNT